MLIKQFAATDRSSPNSTDAFQIAARKSASAILRIRKCDDDFGTGLHSPLAYAIGVQHARVNGCRTIRLHLLKQM